MNKVRKMGITKAFAWELRNNRGTANYNNNCGKRSAIKPTHKPATWPETDDCLDVACTFAVLV